MPGTEHAPGAKRPGQKQEKGAAVYDDALEHLALFAEHGSQLDEPGSEPGR
ncbi:MAG: hypothetical protein AMXMBFR57_21260 [Acidimicrobiia bacterium]|jgi:hypothetical protein